MKTIKFSRAVAAGLAVFGVYLAVGCATTDTVSSRFPQLQEKINAAKAAEAEAYAPVSLRSAEAKLAQARAAVQVEDMDTAHKLVDEAMADADYALTVAPAEKAKKAAMKLREEILSLRNEIKKMPAVK